MYRKQTKFLLIIFIVISILIIVPIIIFLPETIKMRKLYEQAHYEYENSRADPTWEIESYDFITQGIIYNMNESEVNSILNDASVKHFHKSLEIRSIYHDPIRWNGYVNMYNFEFGERYYDPFNKMEIASLREEYTVYFDPNGLAKEITRNIFKLIGTDIYDQKIDLKK